MRAAAALTVSALAFGVAGGASASAPAPPLLRLVDREPVVLSGLRFEPRERVRITVRTSDGRQVRIVRATPTGTFLARFTLVEFDHCGFAASVTGSLGSRSTLKLPQRMCPPPLARP